MKHFETVIGALVVLGASFFLWYASQFSTRQFSKTYPLYVLFTNASGVSLGADVFVSGVKVGSVSQIGLDKETYQAKIELSIRDDVQFPDDSSVKVSSDGLLGGSHIVIEPGSSEQVIARDGVFAYSQGAVSLVDLLGRAVFSMGQAASGSTHAPKTLGE